MNEEIIKIKYILYARKSSESEDRQVLSIDSQIDELKALTKRSGLVITEIRQEAYSAKAPGRTIFNSMLDDIEAGKVQGIIVWNPDRLSRNSMDTGRLIYLFDLGKLLEIVTPGQVFRNTPNDKFLLNLLCSQAKLENDNKGINVKRGLKAKAERGIYPAPAPLGYLNDKYAERGNKTIVKDPERFDMVRKMFGLMLEGTYAPLKILRIVNNKWHFRTANGKKLGKSSIYNLFTRPFYYSVFEYPLGSGNWHKGIHEPMITEAEYDRIQTLLGRDGKQRSKTHEFAFTGMIRCGECGCMITAEEKMKHQKNGNTHHYIYYRCTKKKELQCSQLYIEKKKLEEQILDKIKKIEIPSQFHEWALKWLRKQNEKDAAFTTHIISNHQNAYKECIAKIDSLIDMRAAKEITAEEFQQRKAGLTKDKIRLEELMADTGDSVDKRLKKAEEFFDLALNAREIFEGNDLDKQRKTLAKLGSNLILKDKILSISIEKPIIVLESVAKEARVNNRRLEPIKKRLTQRDFEHSYSQNPRLLPGLDSNQD